MDTSPQMNQTSPTPQPSPRQNNIGPVIGIIIIIVVLLLGGLYFWGQRVDDLSDDTQELRETSDSDDVADIEADLDEDFNDLDAELESFGTEMEGEF